MESYSRQKSYLRTLEIKVENLAPTNGTILSSVWFGFHDGSFTVYNLGSVASPALERIAEDGNTGPLINEFQRIDAGIVQGTLFGSDNVFNNIFPGSTILRKVVIDGSLCNSRYFSYAAMIIPSNDAFIANHSPVAHPVFDDEGNFLGADFTIAGSEVLDAGTEVNDEAPFNAAGAGPVFIIGAGVAENGVVRQHEGYKPGGTILSNPAFVNANFKVDGYLLARITVSEA